MEDQSLEQYLQEMHQKQWAAGIDRELKIIPVIPFITSIIGARRTGKSTLMKQVVMKLPRNEVLYVDFEHHLFDGMKGDIIPKLMSLHAQLYGKITYLFFDEIQVIEGWQKHLRALYELQEYKIVITGSSSKMLSSEIATELRGRSITQQLFPFSFREISNYQSLETSPKTQAEKDILLGTFRTYMEKGGYPQLYLAPQFYDQFWKDYSDLVLFRDIVDRYNLQNIALLKRMLRYFIGGFSKEVSMSKLLHTLKSQGLQVSKSTLYLYREHFGDSMFFHFLSNQKLRSSEQKVYLNDPGLGVNEAGRVLENILYLDLKKNYRDIHYLQHDKGECDFVVPGKYAFQCCYELHSENEQREYNGLLHAAHLYGIPELILITFDQESEVQYQEKTIRIIPLWKWLLHPLAQQR